MVFPLMSLLLDKSYKDSYDLAKTSLKLSQDYGVNETIWNINLNNGDFFPYHNRTEWEILMGQKKEYRRFFEDKEGYISRIITNGKNIRLDGSMFSIMKSIGLECKIVSEEDYVKQEDRIFFTPQENLSGIMLEKVEGIVPIHIHNLTLNYNKWHYTKELYLKKGTKEYRPDKIEFF